MDTSDCDVASFHSTVFTAGTSTADVLGTRPTGPDAYTQRLGTRFYPQAEITLKVLTTGDEDLFVLAHITLTPDPGNWLT